MGEVGNTVTEDPPAQMKSNGELNGNHVDEQDEAMDVDENHSVAVNLKKAIKDGDNEPEVPSETNGKDKIKKVDLDSSKNVLEIDENESLNGDKPQPEEITVPGNAENSEDGTLSSEKDALELPDNHSNKMDTNPVVLSDSSDEDSGSEDGNSSSTSKFRSAERSAAVSESEGISNGALSTNISRTEEDDDDKPVSIHSDSDEKDDCIMIDDVGKKSVPIKPTNESPRRIRKSSVHQMTDFDDDIEEIVEDPLEMDNPAKRIKLSGTTITSVDLSRPSSSSSASSAYPVNLSTNSRSSSGSSQALNLTKKSSGNSLLNPFATQAAQASSSISSLPNLTDDMFVLEAPSFIVPYIYEKPPSTSLKAVVQDIGRTITQRETAKRHVDEEISESENNNQKSAESSSDLDDKKNDKGKKGKSKRRGAANGDESWDEYNTSTDEEASDGEKRTKVLIKESHADIESIKTHIISPETISESIIGENKTDSYFESPLGKFFMTIGVNLVQEYVQSDLLRQQKRKREKEGKAPSATTQMAINSLQKSLEVSKENNAPFKHKMKRCDFCSFKTESELILSQHYEIPHFKNNIYKCNYCEYEARPVHDILYHMEAIHNIKGRLEKPLSYHQCPNCPFEDNGKSKMVRHEAACAKKYKPEINLCPPLDWEPPAKIPRIKAKHGLVGAATAYQAMAAQQQQRVAQANAVAANISSLQRNNTAVMAASIKRGRQQNVSKPQNNANSLRNDQFKNFNANMLSNNYQLAAATLAAANTQFLQQVVAQKLAMLNPAAAAAAGNSFLPGLSNASSSKSKSSSTPSISITPLPRQQQQQAGIKPGQSPNAGSGKPQFVICEICDGYIKDLDQLRNHMQWIHKVKIHPKMIYNRPPLNCQKCQYRFFTDQGLERHLLGSHGLVTSSMQEAANNGKDSGRCPVCGKVFQWKLLNHVSRDHNMTLKPAHLSYKCTVCTATFGMYKLFENHVYSAHSTVAKKDNKNKSSTSTAGSSSGNNSLLKPLKINDEITIIPQPTKRMSEMESHIID